MKKTKVITLFSKFTIKNDLYRTIIPFLLATILFAATITPLYAQLTPARDLTGTWRSGVSGIWYIYSKIVTISSSVNIDPTDQVEDNSGSFIT
jgi:hypothetical protein